MKCTKLIYKSPVFGSVVCDELPTENHRHVDFSPRTACALYDKGPEVELFLTENIRDLAEHVPEELQDLVVRAIFGISHLERGELYLLTEICVKKELTEDQVKLIEGWIEGQLSDGWGESLEQKEAYTEMVTANYPYFDEDECEFRDDEMRVEACYYLHPWSCNSYWSLDLVTCQAEEVDIEEPNVDEELRQSVLKIKELIDEVVEELKKIT